MLNESNRHNHTYANIHTHTKNTHKWENEKSKKCCNHKVKNKMGGNRDISNDKKHTHNTFISLTLVFKHVHSPIIYCFHLNIIPKRLKEERCKIIQWANTNKNKINIVILNQTKIDSQEKTYDEKCYYVVTKWIIFLKDIIILYLHNNIASKYIKQNKKNTGRNE